jgi:hypothetical protein
VAGSRAIVYFTHVDARQTALLSSLLMPLSAPEGWKGIVAFDSDGRSPAYLLLSNFAGRQHRPTGISTALGAPVFTVATTIDKGGATAALTVEENHSVAQPLHFLVRGDGIEAVQAQGDPGTISMRNLRKGKNDITVVAFDGTKRIEQRMTLHKKPVRLTLKDGKLKKLN